MTKRLLCVLILFFSSFIRIDAQNRFPNKINLPSQLLNFIPKEYAVLDIAEGDLNLDSFPDIILVLKKIGEDTALNTSEYKRPLLIFLGDADKSYSLAARNDNIVYCFQCGGVFGDPYDGIEIKKGLFTLHHFGGSSDRWSNDIIFKYSKIENKWYLFRIVDKGWSVFDVEKIDKKIKTKKDFGAVSFEEYVSDDN